jgi:hypothetical protein
MKLKELTQADCVRSMRDTAPNDSNAGLVCVLPLSFFKPEHRKPENQYFRVSGGFGISPSTFGNACFGHWCVDGEKSRVERYQLLGVGNDEVQRIGAELEKAYAKKKEGLTHDKITRL